MHGRYHVNKYTLYSSGLVWKKQTRLTFEKAVRLVCRLIRLKCIDWILDYNMTQIDRTLFVSISKEDCTCMYRYVIPKQGRYTWRVYKPRLLLAALLWLVVGCRVIGYWRLLHSLKVPIQSSRPLTVLEYLKICKHGNYGCNDICWFSGLTACPQYQFMN